MKLKFIDIKKFKKQIYKYYKKIFPSCERNSFRWIKKIYKLNFCKFVGIYLEDTLVGFMIINILDGIPFIQLDYLAILPEYQNKGYGSQSLKLLKNLFKQYKGVIGDVEAVGYGKNKEENDKKLKRKNFYEKLGFIFLNYEVNLWDTIYTPVVLYFEDEILNEEELINYEITFLKILYSEKEIKKYCNFKSIS